VLIAQSFVRNQGDGWTWTLDWLRRAMSESEANYHDASDPFAGYLSFAASVGRRLAQMHAALARPTEDPNFAPRPATKDDVKDWSAKAAAELGAALDAVARHDKWEGPEAAALVGSLLDRRSKLLQAVRGLRPNGALLKTRVHGDFHLGQVLVAQGDAVIVDFEGEPARSLAERRAKTSPAKDIAGLLRSFDYAAAMLAAEFDTAPVDSPVRDRRRAALDVWLRDASVTFLDAYRDVASQDPHPWLRKSKEQDIIDIFLIEKVAYEIAYEIANRPAWVTVPLSGLDRLARRLLS
jgi:maltose alpha-D-glucosyltransferase/alpha-amylase